MNVEGMFKHWEFSCHTIDNGSYSLWICNGFISFHDYSHGGTSPLLSGVTLLERWAIWREYKRELSLRAKDTISEMRLLIKENDNEQTK